MSCGLRAFGGRLNQIGGLITFLGCMLLGGRNIEFVRISIHSLYFPCSSPKIENAPACKGQTTGKLRARRDAEETAATPAGEHHAWANRASLCRAPAGSRRASGP